MSKSKQKRYKPEFKARVAMAAIRGEKTIAQLSSEYGIHSTSINQWRRELLQGAALVFEPREKRHSDKGEQEVLLQQLYAKVGELTVERDSPSLLISCCAAACSQ